MTRTSYISAIQRCLKCKDAGVKAKRKPLHFWMLRCQRLSCQNIELGLLHQNRPPEEAALAALAMPGDRLADLFSAGRHLATAGCLKLPRRQASIITTQISGHATQILAGCRRQF